MDEPVAPPRPPRISLRMRPVIIGGTLLCLGAGLVVFGLLDDGGSSEAIEESPRASPDPPPPSPPRPQSPPSDRFAPRVYGGPDGPKTLPLDKAFIVNVWLQGCQDCMPSFEAWKRLYDAGDIPRSVPIVNVAYGDVDPAWAERYGVRDTLLVDDGSKLVKPQMITSFTTLVVTAERKIVWRGHPKHPDYLDQLKAALAKLPKE